MSLTLRRNFVTAFLGAASSALAVSVLYPVVRFLSPPRIPEATGDRVLAGKISELSTEKWKIFPFGSEPGILVEAADGRLLAFSAACTHLGCTVQFDAPSKRIWCACHNGWYDLDGKNVAGPPPRPLTSYKVQVVDDEIFVTRG